ncbi:hypothetical protein SOVF_196500, partial [Spinacia oleracea]
HGKCVKVYLPLPLIDYIAAENADNRSLVDLKPKFLYESADKSKIWKLTEINKSLVPVTKTSCSGLLLRAHCYWHIAVVKA